MVTSGTPPVAYKDGGDNGVLRSVLYSAWKFRCYWCKQPQQFPHVDIDHIIAKTTSAAHLQAIIAELGLPDEFDVNDPRNLALICKPCNVEKGAQDFSHAPVLLSKLKKAERLRAQVIKKVGWFGHSSDIANALLFATEASLEDPESSQAFVELAPAVVQRLALVDESLVDYKTVRQVSVEVGSGEFLEVSVTIDATARRSLTVLADVCDQTLEDLLQEPLSDVLEALHVEAQGRMEGALRDEGEPDTGWPVNYVTRMDVGSVQLHKSGGELSFEVAGEFEAGLSAVLVLSADDGDGLKELQGDAYLTGSYSFEAVWDQLGGEPGVSEPILDYDETACWATA